MPERFFVLCLLIPLWSLYIIGKDFYNIYFIIIGLAEDYKFDKRTKAKTTIIDISICKVKIIDNIVGKIKRLSKQISEEKKDIEMNLLPTKNGLEKLDQGIDEEIYKLYGLTNE